MRFGRTVAELSETLTWDEYCRWEIYFRRFPFDPESSNQLPAAQICTTLQMVNGAQNVKIPDNLIFRPKDDGDFGSALVNQL